MKQTRGSDGWVSDWNARLRAMRVRAGLTQRQLAQASGISEQMITFVETGRRVPSRALAYEWARACGAVETFRIADLLDVVGLLPAPRQETVRKLVELLADADASEQSVEAVISLIDGVYTIEVASKQA